MVGMSAGDLGVDVLVLGAGLQALYVASALADRYSVCVVDDPAMQAEDLDGHGMFTAGYEGNDVARVQPARRAASFWRLWGEERGLLSPATESVWAAPAAPGRPVSALWSDAALPFTPIDELPEPLRAGVASGWEAFRIPGETVLDPAGVARALLEPVSDRVIRGTDVRFAMFGDDQIDTVEVDVDGEVVPILARYVVVAADAGNGALLARLASRIPDARRRREAREAVARCQANRRQPVVAVRGELPPLSGWLGGLRVTSHRPARGDTDDELVWLVSPPPHEVSATVGPEDLRFTPSIDRDVVGATAERLLQLSPDVFRRAHRLRWTTWTARRTEHPMIATDDLSSVGQPVPARMETLGLEGFVALWPSHPSYTMILGDVVAERVADALGASAAFSEGVQPQDLIGFDRRHYVDRWDRSTTEWHSWEDFAETYDVQPG